MADTIPSKSVIQKIMDMVSKRPTPEPQQGPGIDQPAGGAGPSNGMAAWYYDFIRTPEDRIQAMCFYDYLEKEVADVELALTAYATMATTGSMTGLSRGTFTLRFPPDAPAEYAERCKSMQDLFRRHGYAIARGMCKYGSFIPQIDIGIVGNRLGVVDLDHLPPGTMFRNLKGNQDTAYWQQIIDGKKGNTLSRWQYPHFAIWSSTVNALQVEIYGRSMLARAGRLALQLAAMIDSLVIGRLTRANQHTVFKVDIADLKNDDKKILQRLRQYAEATSRKRSLVTNGGVNSWDRPPIPDERSVIPAGKELGWNLEALANDAGVTSVDDINLFVEFWAGAIGVPPEYLGHGNKRGGRSNLSQVDINFARTSRHIQMFEAAGFEEIVTVHMLLQGLDPEKYPPEIVPPTIGARDDLLTAQVRALQSTVLANLVTAGFKPNVAPDWILRTFLNMDDDLQALPAETIAKLFEDPAVAAAAAAAAAGGGDGKDVPAKVKKEQLALISANTQQLVTNIRALLSMDEEEDQMLYGFSKMSPAVIRSGIEATIRAQG